jgi:diguanylate cyclase (GGDEF)-like protein
MSKSSKRFHFLKANLIISILIISISSCISYANFGNGVKFDYINLEEKYNKDPIISINQDNTGFLWFLTNKALIRFDGENYRPFEFSKSDLDSESSLELLSCEFDNGVAWIGTKGFGLVKFDMESGDYQVIPSDSQNFEDNKFNAIKSMDNDNLLIGTDSGLKKFNKKSLMYIEDSLITTNLNVHKKSITTMQADHNKNIWLATEENVFKFDIKNKNFLHLESNKLANIKTICIDLNGIVWMGSSNGLYRYDSFKKNIQAYKYDINTPNSLSGNNITHIYTNNKGYIFITTLGGGLSVFDIRNEIFESYQYDFNDPFSLYGNDVYSSFEDSSGNLWFGNTGTVSKINWQKNAFSLYKKIYTYPNSLYDNRTTAVYEDIQGNLWIGTKKGLDKFEKSTGKFIHYLYDPNDTESLSSDYILSITGDSNGDIWIGTKGGGLNKFIASTRKFIHYKNNPIIPNSISNDNVTSLIHDSNGNLWVGTIFGLNMYNAQNNTFIRYTEKGYDSNSLTSYKIKALSNGQIGEIWIGTDNGLNRFDTINKKFQHYKSESGNTNSLSSDLIEYIHTDKDGILWIATSLGGLVRFDPSKNEFKSITTKEGLPSNNISGVLSDGNNLWLSSQNGLSKYNLTKNQIINYNISYGLQKNEFNPGVCFKSPSGKMYFGGDNGLNFFMPEDFSERDFRPQTAITSVKKLEELINSLKNIRLPYKYTTISFEFASFDYTFPEKNKFMYKLEGLDEDWVNSDTRRFVRYSNLDGGNYTFKVKGSDSFGNWSDNVSEVSFHLQTPPWKTWWAYTIYSIIFVLGIYTFIRIRTKMHQKEINRQKVIVENLRKIDKIKDEFLANTSHELRTPLNGIIGMTQGMIETNKNTLTEKNLLNLNLILKSSKRLLSLVNDILDYSKIKKQELVIHIETVNLCNVLEDILPLIQTIYSKKNITVINEITPDIPAIMGNRFRLEQIFYNIIGNALKFTDEGLVKIYSSISDNMLEVHISDSGIGIPPDKLDEIFREFTQINGDTDREHGGTGLGLSVTKGLIEAMSGKLIVESEVNKGSTFTFRLPISNEKAVVSKEVDSQHLSYADIMDTYIESNFNNRKSPSKNISIKDDFDNTNEIKKNPIIVEKLMDFEHNTYKILIVDDDITNLHVLINYIESKDNFEVITAESGFESLELIQEQGPFDIILLDVMMPKMSGYEVCRRIRTKYSLFELPIIMLTAKNQPKDIVEGFESGANDYLVKPFDYHELHARIKTPIILKYAIQNLITNTLKFEIEKKQRLLSETLKEISEALTSTLNIEEVLCRLIDSVKNMVYYDSALILIGEQNKMNIKRYRSPIPKEKFFQHIDDLKNNESLYDFFKDKDLLSSCNDNLFELDSNYNDKSPQNSWIDVPITFQDNILGFIILYNKIPNAYSNNEEVLIKAIANQAGIALENARLFSKVATLASLDSLTNTLNRKSFFDRAKTIFDSLEKINDSFALLMIDIDKFKNVNDTYGHIMGDKVIIDVADIILSCIEGIGIAGRFGGEEFIVLLREESKKSFNIAENIRKSIENIIFEDDLNRTFSVSVSIGIANYDGSKNLNHLTQLADKALYQAKNSGRNQTININTPRELVNH